MLLIVFVSSMLRTLLFSSLQQQARAMTMGLLVCSSNELPSLIAPAAHQRRDGTPWLPF
jgi:hypothetical protein